MRNTWLLSAAALIGALGMVSTPAQAQQGWTMAEPAAYDQACGEPDNGECYSTPMTSVASPGGRYELIITCDNVLAITGVRGTNGELQFSFIALSVDGTPQGQYSIGGGLDLDYLDPQAAPGLMGALRSGRTLTMLFDGVTVSNIALAGAGPALDSLERACAAGVVSPPPQQQQPVVQAPATRQRQYFSDYMATCRPDGGCDATTFTDTPTSNGQTFVSSLTFNRAGFPGTAWMLSFAGAFEGPVPGTPIQVRIGRETWNLSPNDGWGTISGHNFFYWPYNEQLLGAMLAGADMDVTQTIENGRSQTVRYSLRGLTAAMRWMDQLQGRTGEPMMIGVPSSLEEIIPGYQP